MPAITAATLIKSVFSSFSRAHLPQPSLAFFVVFLPARLSLPEKFGCVWRVGGIDPPIKRRIIDGFQRRHGDDYSRCFGDALNHL